MRPDLETFTKAVRQYRGNLSKVADAFGVSRATVGNWRRENPEYDEVVQDARKRLFDDCLASAEILAKGILAYETNVDPVTGKETKTVIGWQERPDGNMVRYLLGCLGRDEGFGENAPSEVTVETGIAEAKQGISIQVFYNDKKDLDLQGTRKEDEEEK